MSIAVQKAIPAARMRQFHTMVERWLEEGPIKLATSATITALGRIDIQDSQIS